MFGVEVEHAAELTGERQARYGTIVIVGGGKGLKGPVIFHCTHRAYGVGMLVTADVIAANHFIAAECAGGGDVLIGTVSHCHGALNVLSVSSQRAI